MADVFVVNSGYRTRYPHGAVATSRPAGRRGAGPERQGRHQGLKEFLANLRMALVWLFRSKLISNRRPIGRAGVPSGPAGGSETPRHEPRLRRSRGMAVALQLIKSSWPVSRRCTSSWAVSTNCSVGCTLAHYSQSSQVSTFSRSEVESGMGVGSLVRVEVGAGIVLHELLGHLPGQALQAGSGHRVGDPAVGDRNLEMLRERESGRPLASGSEQAKAPRQRPGAACPWWKPSTRSRGKACMRAAARSSSAWPAAASAAPGATPSTPGPRRATPAAA